MTAKEVLRKTAGLHRGYMPVSIWAHKQAPFCWNIATILQKIPNKVSAYFKRELITEVRKANIARRENPAGLYYLQLTDGTYLEVEY